MGDRECIVEIKCLWRCFRSVVSDWHCEGVSSKRCRSGLVKSLQCGTWGSLVEQYSIYVSGWYSNGPSEEHTSDKDCYCASFCAHRFLYEMCIFERFADQLWICFMMSWDFVLEVFYFTECIWADRKFYKMTVVLMLIEYGMFLVMPVLCHMHIIYCVFCWLCRRMQRSDRMSKEAEYRQYKVSGLHLHPSS